MWQMLVSEELHMHTMVYDDDDTPDEHGRPLPRYPAAAAVASRLQYVRARGLLDANNSFYTAFRAKDLVALRSLWLRDDGWQGEGLSPWRLSVLERMGASYPQQSCCRHPGRTYIFGYGSIITSWEAILTNSIDVQYPIQTRHIRRFISPCGTHGEVALLEELFGQHIAVINHFVLVEEPDGKERWRMIIHEAQ